MIDVVYLKTFVHGRINASAGARGCIPEMDARALARAGLLRIVAEAPVVKKTVAAGVEPLSSASPAAQALPEQTSTLSGDGETPSPRRRGRRKKGELS